MKIIYIILAAALLPVTLKAQEMQFFRPNNQQGLMYLKPQKLILFHLPI